MRVETTLATPSVTKPRRSLSDRVRDAVQEISAGQANILHHTEKNWASITFAGTRHCLTLEFDGETAVAAGENLLAALPDHEFSIHGQLVADAIITQVDHTLAPAPRMQVQAELLLLEDC